MEGEGWKFLFFMCKLILLLFIAIIIVSVRKAQEEPKMSFSDECAVNCTSAQLFCDENGRTMANPLSPDCNCFPADVQSYAPLFLLNITVISLIGGLGNVLTLIAIPYAYFKYTNLFTARWNGTTALMLHLSLCDLAYILFGLTFFISIYANGDFVFSDDLCWWTAFIRNLVCYADFLTLAAIAVIRMIGMKNPFDPDLKKSLNSQCLIISLCVLTWALSLLIIHPMLFGYPFFNYPFDWGKFGKNPMRATCNTITCPGDWKFSPPAFVYTVGFFLPFFCIMIAYLTVIPIFMKQFTSYKKSLSTEDRQNYTDTCEINSALWLLAISYFIFTAPLVVVEWLEVTELPDYVVMMATIIGYNWYWWIYAINFIVYIVSLEDFRTMYWLFLSDVLNACFLWRFDLNSHSFIAHVRQIPTASNGIVVNTAPTVVVANGGASIMCQTTNFMTPHMRPSAVPELLGSAELSSPPTRLTRSRSAPPTRRRRRKSSTNPRDAVNDSIRFNVDTGTVAFSELSAHDLQQDMDQRNGASATMNSRQRRLLALAAINYAYDHDEQ
eukprot:TRINITY_DN7083_c0_g1_i12.p1 TRINITY_DN7083_c0_g1~~TRINITY_DN7083_c0_g1_i12.p1  ORF type:complete len:554 (-),score=74.19 TRINITY_DN7083_c0_g1_i12:102-1763(-)